jgi:hypothetical protein
MACVGAKSPRAKANIDGDGSNPHPCGLALLGILPRTPMLVLALGAPTMADKSKAKIKT